MKKGAGFQPFGNQQLMVKDGIYSKSIIEYFYDFDIPNPMYLT